MKRRTLGQFVSQLEASKTALLRARALIDETLDQITVSLEKPQEKKSNAKL